MKGGKAAECEFSGSGGGSRSTGEGGGGELPMLSEVEKEASWCVRSVISLSSSACSASSALTLSTTHRAWPAGRRGQDASLTHSLTPRSLSFLNHLCTHLHRPLPLCPHISSPHPPQLLSPLPPHPIHSLLTCTHSPLPPHLPLLTCTHSSSWCAQCPEALAHSWLSWAHQPHTDLGSGGW